MRYAAVTDRLAGLGADKWAVHFRGRALAEAGVPVIELTIGEPDRPPDAALIAATRAGLSAGRTRYADGRGDPALREALAARYTARSGREVTPAQVLAVPGTQAALFASIASLAGPGDAVAVVDPMYATYQGVIAASGARLAPVAVDPDAGFRLTSATLEAALTPDVRVLLLNSPHNPAGTVLTEAEIDAIGAVCAAHDLWIVSDEVYESLILDGTRFASPFDRPALADRTLALSSVSKSHAAPGLRSGWIVGPEEACARIQPLIEMMFFGMQPFVADATTEVLRSGDAATAEGLRGDYRRRAAATVAALAGAPGLRAAMPQAGMFLMLDVRGTGADGDAFAASLLDAERVSVMPGSSFGDAARGFVRVSLTVPDETLAEAATRLARHAARLVNRA